MRLGKWEILIVWGTLNSGGRVRFSELRRVQTGSESLNKRSMTPEKYFLIHSQHKAISDSAKRLQRKELIFIKMEYQHDFSTAPKAELALLTEKGFRQASSIGMVNENSPDIIRIYDSSGEYHGEYFRAYDESPDGTRLPLYDEEDMMVDTLPMIDSARGLEGESTQ